MVVDDAVGLGVALMLPAEDEAEAAALLLLIPGLMDESLLGDDDLLGDALLPI